MYCISYQHVAFICTNRDMGIATYDSKYFLLCRLPTSSIFLQFGINILMFKQMQNRLTLQTLSVPFSSKGGI